MPKLGNGVKQALCIEIVVCGALSQGLRVFGAKEK